jgi:hypothetical protein
MNRELQIDQEFQELIPPLSQEERAGLEQNLIDNGCRVPLDVWQETNILLDGHHRYDICMRHNIPYKVNLLSLADRNAAQIWIIRNQFDRRNLNAYNRSVLALKMEGIYKEKAKENLIEKGRESALKQHGRVLENSPKPITPVDTRKEVAKSAGVSDNTIARVKKIEEKATPEVKGKLEQGEISINEAYKQVKREERKEKQREKENSLIAIIDKDSPLYTLTKAQDVIQCAALITDPPYGILDEPWEPNDLENFTCQWAARWNACNADTLSIFWSQRYLWEGRKWFDRMFTNYDFQQMLIWVYRNNKSPQSRKGFKQTWEPIFFYRKKESTREIGIGAGTWGENCHDMDTHIAAVPQSNFNDANRKVHPAQKPVEVLQWLINATTRPGELVADPFMGSGTTGIAALQLQRRFHGIENNPAILELAQKRIKCYGKIS